MNEITQVMGEEDRRRAREQSVHGVRPPALVPGYEQPRFLGRGAFGEVWLAIEKNTGRQVAIKFYAHRDAPDWPQMSREVEKLRFLFSDRHVVQLLHVGWDADPPFFVMEFMEQGSLEDFLKRRGPLPASEAVPLLRDIATGLVHAHRKGILHCDLKPDNVLLDQDGRPRLADFGQARLPHENVPALGTLFYMAPEQADLKARPDPRWDVYALGAVLYRMLVGAPPYHTEDCVTLLSRGTSLHGRLEQYRAFLHKSPPPLAHRQAPGVDRSLADIIERCLSLDPNRRFPTVQAVVEALDARAVRRARRALLVMGGLGPVLLLLVMTLIGGEALNTAVRESRTAIIGRALESDRFAARFVAEQFALAIDKRWRMLDYAASDASLHDLMTQWAKADATQRPAIHDRLNQWITARRDRSNIQFRSGTEARAWFLLDARGRMLAISPPNESLLSQKWAHRDFFHGQGIDLDPNQPGYVQPRPLRQAHRSPVLRSKVSKQLVTVLSVPIRLSPKAEPAGVLCMAVELGAFADFLGTDDQFAVLFDLRKDAVNHRKGLIMEHRDLDGKPESKEETYYVDPEVVERAATLRDQRVKEYEKGAQVDVNYGQADLRDFVGDYVDPISTRQPNRWLATLEPVVVVRPGGKVVDTGFATLVQERYGEASAPVDKLHYDLIKLGAVGLALVALVVGGLWGFVVIVLNENTRAKMTKLLRRVAGLRSTTHSEGSLSSSSSRSSRPPLPNPGPTATYDYKPDREPEETKPTERVERGG